MLHDLLDSEEAPPPRTLWVPLVALAAALLVMFWLVCSHQVRMAEARSAETQMAQTALADCLQYIPGSTIASCNARLSQPAGSSQTAVATPVGFVGYR